MSHAVDSVAVGRRVCGPFLLAAGRIAAAVVLRRLIGWWLARHDDRDAWRRRRDAELCARADRQHAAVLAGDQHGVYGNYPPAV